MNNQKAKLVLEDGTTLEGEAAGYPKSTAGEVVFATGMTGYDLSLTDPSYAGQILTFTYPLIGNWGVPQEEFWESEKIQVLGVVISDLTTAPSHPSMQKTLNDWLTSEKIPAIVGIDTRALTQKLRDKGVMPGKIVIGDQDVEFDDPNERNLVAEVSISEPKIHFPNSKLEYRNSKQYQNSNDKKLKRLDNSNFENYNLFRASDLGIRNSPKIALLNCGAKRNIARLLTARGATVYELPWDYDPFGNGWQSWKGSRQPFDFAQGKRTALLVPSLRGSGRETTDRTRNNLPIDALIISNGPGDPKMAKESIAIIKKALNKKIPTFGVCLGNQLLALAAGGNTYKLKFGHRAQNQPTMETGSKRCYITTQNHGFAVNDKKLPYGFKRWFYNANDNTNEGIIHEKLPFFSVQFHPEAAPGPTDTSWLFDYFLERIRNQ